METDIQRKPDGMWSARTIPLAGIVAALLAFLLREYVAGALSSAGVGRLELPLIGLIYILAVFAIALVNWGVMGKKLKVILHIVLCTLVLALYTWLADTAGYPPPTPESLQDTQVINVALLVLLTVYLFAAMAIDLRSFRAAHQPAFHVSCLAGGMSLALILAGWLSILWGLNYFSAQVGLCKFPPAYSYFQEKGSRSIYATALLTSADFDCRYLRHASPLDFVFEAEASSTAAKLPFNSFLYDDFHGGSYSSGMETYFYSHLEMGVEQMVWFKREELTKADIQNVVMLAYFDGPQKPGDLGLFPENIPGPQYQQHYCKQASRRINCNAVLAYKHIIVGLVLRGPEGAFESALPNAILRLNDRLLELDGKIPLDEVITMR